MTNYFKKRHNMVQHTTENYKPPLIFVNNNLRGKLINVIRRFLDLQFGSVWSDLALVLPHVTGTVLDVGCGSQPFKILFQPQVKYIGVDTIDLLSNFGYQNPETLYYSGDQLPIQNHAADFVLCTETLEHVLDPALLLSEIIRCLKPHGKMLLTVPFSARWHFIPFDYWRFTPSSLFHLLEKSGFINIKIYARGNSVSVAGYKLMSILLPFLFSNTKNKLKKIGQRALGFCFLPTIFLLALLANIATLYTKKAEDCLGYTVMAEKGDL